jgi:hypothetical protein
VAAAVAVGLLAAADESLVTLAFVDWTIVFV